MVTLLALVPFATLQSGAESPSQNIYGSHIVLTLLNRLFGVDDPCLR